MTKLQLTITDQEAAILAGYGNQLGYNVPKTAKFFLSQATAEIIKQGIIPVYEMSEKTEQKGLDALEEHRLGKTHEMNDIEF